MTSNQPDRVLSILVAPPCVPRGGRDDRGTGDAVGVKMVAVVLEISPFASRADGVLRPTQEDSDLSNVERSRAVLKHLWNTTAVHDWGSLVRIGFDGCYAG